VGLHHPPGIELRKRCGDPARVRERERDPGRRWFFETFVPDRHGTNPAVAHRTRLLEDAPTDALPPMPATGSWRRALAGTARPCGAGLRHHRPQQLILLTPGFGRATAPMPSTASARWWPVSAREPVVPEKNDLNSLLFLLTPGWNRQGRHAVEYLVRLQAAARRHARLRNAIGDFVRRRPARYSGCDCANCGRNARLLSR